MTPLKESAPFQLDFALDSNAHVELDGKALRIEGYAAGFNTDRENEAFLPGVFDRGLDKYFKSNPVLCYHHHTDQALGVVESAKLDGKGLFIKARLDDPEPNTPLADVYNKVKSGTIKGFSVGGIFRRKMTPAGMRIHSTDIAEISVTPVPMEAGSLFSVAGKAFDGFDSPEEEAIAKITALVDDLEGKAIASGYMRHEMPQLVTPGDIAKAVDRTAEGVEEEEDLREHIMNAAFMLDCENLLPSHWFADDEDEDDGNEAMEGKAVSAAKRKGAKYHLPGTDKYPIDNCSDVAKAVKLVGNSTEDASKVKAYIKRVANSLGCTEKLPEDW